MKVGTFATLYYVYFNELSCVMFVIQWADVGSNLQLKVMITFTSTITITTTNTITNINFAWKSKILYFSTLIIDTTTTIIITITQNIAIPVLIWHK